MRGRAGLVLLLAAWGCSGRHETAAPGQRAQSSVRGELVARVDGAPIGSEEVREVARGASLTPREALSRLEDERVLFEQAITRGYARADAVAREERRAIVQALLARTVEQDHRPESIPLAAVRERFEQVAGQRGIPLESFPEHEPGVRAQLAQEQRTRALEDLLSTLRARYRVELSEEHVQRLLGDPRLWDDGT